MALYELGGVYVPPGVVPRSTWNWSPEVVLATAVARGAVDVVA